jgi:hypothetical protein
MDQQPEMPGSGATQRIWMERAKLNAEMARQDFERPLWPRLVGLALSLALVATVLLGFNSFLSALGRYLDTPIGPEAPAVEPEEQAAAMPVFVVPDETEVGPVEPAAEPPSAE